MSESSISQAHVDAILGHAHGSIQEEYVLKRFFFSFQSPLFLHWGGLKLKALANEDTLLRTHCCRHKCFPVCPRAKHLLRTQILCPGHKKCFWFCSETFYGRNKCFPVCAAWKHNIHLVSRAFARPKNIMSNNVSATMCPRLPGP